MELKKITSLGLLTAMCTSFGFSAQAAHNKINVINEDFEGFATGTKLSDTGLGWIVSDSNEGDSITIETDPISGSKAIKLTQAFYEKKESGNPTTGFEIPFDTISDGIVDISFKIRCDSWTSRLCDGGIVYAKDGTNLIDFNQYQSAIYTNGLSDWMGTLSADTYKEVNFVCDFTNKSATVSFSGKTFAKNGGISVKDISKLKFNINANYKDLSSGWIDQSSNTAPVYWIDDIVVCQRRISVVSTSVSDGEQNAAIDKNISVTFDKDIKSDGVADNISVFQNDTEIENYIISAGDKQIEISFPGLMEYNTSYRIEFAKIEAEEVGNLPVENYILSFKTERLFDEISDLLDGGIYSTKTIILPQKENVKILATLEKSEGESVEYISGTEITEIGDYMLTVSGANTQNGKIQTDIYNFSIVGEQEPTAQNVKITTDTQNLTPDMVLTGSYEFYDVNNDAEGESLIRWYSADTADGEYQLIVEYKKFDGVFSYKLTENELNKYIKFSVVPMSERAPYEGKEVFSESFIGFFEPIPENVIIKGTAELGETLLAEYSYIDKNGCDDLTGQYQWYRIKDEKKEVIDGAVSAAYTVSEEDANCTLTVGVRIDKAGYVGEYVYSKEKDGLYSPAVENIEIKGTAKPGHSLYVNYSFNDKNGDREGKTVITWYENGKAIYKGEALSITKAMVGSNIRAEVKPMSEKYPYEGAAVSSASVKVSSAVVSSGGGGGSAAPSISYTQQSSEDKKDENAQVTESTGAKTVFNDISGHWAEETIKDMYKKGYINGVSENEFAPEKAVTRAEFATMATNVFEISDGEGSISYSDVGEDAWYSKTVSKMSANGLMSGYDGKFRPNDCITRGEIAVVIMNIAKLYGIYKEPDASAEFSDTDDIAGWAVVAVDYAYSEGIIRGKGDGRFAPLDNATRAESITMIKRLLERVGGNADEE